MDQNQQKKYLIQEMDEALKSVEEWRGQIELLQIDADAFYKAIDRLLSAQVPINLLFNE